MKLAVPYIGELQAVDARLVGLAEFLGVSCQAVPLARDVVRHAEYLERVIPDEASCLVVNPRVLKEWVRGDELTGELVSFVLSRFPNVIVHGLRPDAYDARVVDALSRGRLRSIHSIDGGSPVYDVAKSSKDICGAFSGLSFGPANPGNDHVFAVNDGDAAVRKLISIGGQPFMAVVEGDAAEVLFLASEDVADLNAEAGDAPLAEYFSRLLPQAMALRYVAGDECWRPSTGQASIIIDDPLLRNSYGFLHFDALLRLADRHNFHTAIAFIPHNFRRSSARITRMFRENSKRLSICFHGNDHTGAEFASTDPALLDTMLRVAEERMNLHLKTTGLGCDRVMVFPQGNFSVEAMEVLKAHNFYAAVNTVPYPAEQPVRLTIGELAQPAVLRYGGFPLFIRKPLRRMQSHDIAFSLFFGRPVLIVEHHDIFQRPELLVEVVERINSVEPEVRWSNLATVACNSVLTRRAPDGTYQVRAYSGAIEISNDSDVVRRYAIEWGDSWDGVSIEQVLMDGTPCEGIAADGCAVRVPAELAPGSSRKFALVHRGGHVAAGKLGLRWNAQAFLRRRLSEFRDNYLSKNRHVLTAAKSFQRRFLKV